MCWCLMIELGISVEDITRELEKRHVIDQQSEAGEDAVMAGEYMLSSVHVHSKLCDGKNTLEELAVTAWHMGLKTLGFTGHSHTPCDLEYCMSPSAAPAPLQGRYCQAEKAV